MAKANLRRRLSVIELLHSAAIEADKKDAVKAAQAAAKAAALLAERKRSMSFSVPAERKAVEPSELKRAKPDERDGAGPARRKESDSKPVDGQTDVARSDRPEVKRLEGAVRLNLRC
jgi:hypothetical protein